MPQGVFFSLSLLQSSLLWELKSSCVFLELNPNSLQIYCEVDRDDEAGGEERRKGKKEKLPEVASLKS
jgi:hypothetical protein